MIYNLKYMVNIYLKLSNINLTPEEKQACDDLWKS